MGARKRPDAVTEGRLLARLYAACPPFECEPGCHDCCGPVPMSAVEAKRAGGFCRFTEDGTCAHAAPTGCRIYPHRPFLCRLFGATAAMPCPKGRGPKRRLSVRESDELRSVYRQLVPEAEESRVMKAAVYAILGGGML